jgi:hypothetical protein
MISNLPYFLRPVNSSRTNFDSELLLVNSKSAQSSVQLFSMKVTFVQVSNPLNILQEFFESNYEGSYDPPTEANDSLQKRSVCH